MKTNLKLQQSEPDINWKLETDTFTTELKLLAENIFSLNTSVDNTSSETSALLIELMIVKIKKFQVDMIDYKYNDIFDITERSFGVNESF